MKSDSFTSKTNLPYAGMRCGNNGQFVYAMDLEWALAEIGRLRGLLMAEGIIPPDAQSPIETSPILDHRFLPDNMAPGICAKCSSTKASHKTAAETPAAYILTVRSSGECREFATLPGWHPSPDEDVIRRVPLYRASEKANALPSCPNCGGPLRITGPVLTCDKCAAEKTIAGHCINCGGDVYDRPGKPGQYDHECSAITRTES